ncbi:MAG: hypothetical protein KIS92_06265 [Planctomycetota bacterium]|nr:hypothetical protein [Planctomycetota bacterium]
MPGTYALSPDGILLVTCYSGALTVEEVRALAAARAADLRLRSARVHLIDMESVQMNVSSLDVRAYASFLRNLAPMPLIRRVAVLFGPPHLYGLGRMFATYQEIDGDRICCMPVRSLAEACARLGLHETEMRVFLHELRGRAGPPRTRSAEA